MAYGTTQERNRIGYVCVVVLIIVFAAVASHADDSGDYCSIWRGLSLERKRAHAEGMNKILGSFVEDTQERDAWLFCLSKRSADRIRNIDKLCGSRHPPLVDVLDRAVEIVQDDTESCMQWVESVPTSSPKEPAR